MTQFKFSKEISRRINGQFGSMPYGAGAHFKFSEEYTVDELIENLAKLNSYLKTISDDQAKKIKS